MIQLIVACGLLCLGLTGAGPVGPKIATVDLVAEARRLVHQSNWASVGTISTDSATEGFPMVVPVSTADAQDDEGNIYFYMMDQDIVAQDTQTNNRVTFMFSDAQSGKCNPETVDPWSHLCPRVMISGHIRKVPEGTEEHSTGLKAFFDRHPLAANWNNAKAPGHIFYLCKLDITNVVVFSGFSGYKHITPREYATGVQA